MDLGLKGRTALVRSPPVEHRMNAAFRPDSQRFSCTRRMGEGPRERAGGQASGGQPMRETARAMTSASSTNPANDSSAIRSLARWVSGMVSVALNAIELASEK